MVAIGRQHVRRLSAEDLEQVCHSLGRSLSAGIGLIESLQRLERSGRRDFARSVEAIRAGGTASEALRDSGVFPPLVIRLVAVGETSGQLDRTFLRLADYFREVVRSRRLFKQGLVWPVLQLIAAFIVLGLLFTALHVLQARLAVFTPPDLLGFGLTPLGNLVCVASVFAAIVVLLGGLLKASHRGRLPNLVVRVFRGSPWVGSVVQRFSLARFSWAFGSAIDSGIDAMTAITIASDASGDQKIRSASDAMVRRLQSGDTFESTLAGVGCFPSEMVQAVGIGEATGQLSECIKRVTDNYDEQNVLAMRRFGQVSGLMVSLSVIILLGFTAFSMYLDYMQLLTGALQANSKTIGELRRTGRAGTDAIDSSGLAASSSSENELIATRDAMVKEFLESNADFQKIESIYTTMGRYHEMTANEFLDAITGRDAVRSAPSHSE